MDIHAFIRATLVLLIIFVLHPLIIVEAIGRTDVIRSKTFSKKSGYQYSSFGAHLNKHDVLYKKNKNKHQFTKISSKAGNWKLYQANKVSVIRSTIVSQKKGTFKKDNKTVKQGSSFHSTTKKSKLKNDKNRLVEHSSKSQSTKSLSTTTHVPVASAIKSFFSEKPRSTTHFSSSKTQHSSHNIKESTRKHVTKTHNSLPRLHSLFPLPTESTKKAKETHHQNLGDIIESRISSFFHPPKKTQTDQEKPTRTGLFHFPRPSFLDPLFPHHNHDHSNSSEGKTTSHKTTSTKITSSPQNVTTSTTTTTETPTTFSISSIISPTSSNVEMTKSAVTTVTTATIHTSTTTTHTRTLTSSQSLSYTTRSFSITSSTATPSLVLGIYDCANDLHNVHGKCDYEYFCNSATHQCVALTANGEFCYEDFQCASTYCVSNQCVSYPGYRSGEEAMSGGQIAGATVGSVAGATVVLLGLLGWRRRSQSMNRRMEQIKRSNENVGFYSDYGITPVNPAGEASTRESKYDFLNQMLKNQPPAAAAAIHSTNNPKPGSPSEMSSIQDPWKEEDQEMTPERRYTFF